MKKLFTILLILLLCLLHAEALMAQLRLDTEPQIVSPNVGEMIKADNYSVNLYTGRMTVSIPIYTYTDVEFSVPVSLNYNYNGMRPNELPSEVGLGWFLDCGGVITREVKGFPDEENGTSILHYDESGESASANYDIISHDGIPWGSSFSGEATMYFGSLEFEDTPTTPLQVFYEYQGRDYDYSSDIYHFSFMGHNGSFVRNQDGTFSVYGTQSARENYSIHKRNIYSGDNSHLMLSEFEITIGDGYKYIFGSLLEEYLYNDRIGKKDKDSYPGSITSWKLRKVIAPSGRELSFIHGWKHDPMNLDCYNSLRWYNYRSALSSVGRDDWETETETSSVKRLDTNTLIHIYGAVLERITVDGESIVTFHYDYRSGDKKSQYVAANSNTIDIENDHSPLLLCEIDFANSRAFLTHSYNTSGNPYPFLSEVLIDGIGSYKMLYNNDDSCYFPPYGTSATDHWGYQNANSSIHCNTSSVLWDKLSEEGLHYSETLGTLKNPKPQSSQNGLMTRLLYPTGGWTTFEYQPNDYSRCVDKRWDHAYKPYLYDEDGIGPGHRIFRIKSFDSNGTLLDGREYKYVRTDGGTTSSGQLLASPRYKLSYHGILQKVGIVALQYATTGNIVSHGSALLEYPRVEEINLEGGKTVYTFSSWAEVPDTYDDNYTQLPRCMYNGYGAQKYGFITNISEIEFVHRILQPGGDRHLNRGKILSALFYEAGASSANRVITNTYNYKTKSLPTLMSYSNVGEAYACTPIYTDCYDLVKTTQTDSFPGYEITSETRYMYSPGGQLQVEEKEDSNGNKVRKRYQYISDISESSRTQVQNTMFEMGIKAFPISVSQEINYRGKTEWINEQETQYVYSSYKNKAWNDYYNLSAIREINKDTNCFYDKFKYIYGSNGQMTQRTDANGNCTSYVWSYAGMGVALIIENASNQEIRGVSGMSDLFTKELNANNTETIATTLRMALPNARITSVTYHSYNHPSRVTDPFGKTTTYEYDPNDRLISVSEEGIGKLNEYYYNTKTR